MLVFLELCLEKMTEQQNNLRQHLEEWWDSDACKELQESHRELKERAVGRYFMLSEEEKLDMVQAICHIMCDAEQKGCSHRGLQSALGIYPAGFWVDNLIDVHNALWAHYNDKKGEKELRDDLDALDDFME